MPYRAETIESRQVVETALLLALAAVLGFAESLLLPAAPVAGMRLGIANLAVIVALVRLGPGRAAVVSFGRVLLVGLATGSLASPVGMMSACGAFASWTAMVVLWRSGERFSPVGWSVAGSAAHVLAQLAAASVLIGSSAVISLAPYSLAVSLPTGLAIGLCARLVISRISRPVWSAAGV